MATEAVAASIAGVPTRAPSIGYSRNYHLDAMRGISALIVVFDHMRGIFFVPYRQAGNGWLVRFVYIDHYAARAAVIFFFALSGYLVGTSILKSIQRNDWSWANYLLSRLTRLYVVLIPALLLTVTFVAIGRWNPITAPTYLSDYPPDAVGSFVATIFFLQGVVAPVYAANGPTWSLSYEFSYYVLFPLAALCLIRRGRSLLYGILFLVLAVFFGRTIFLLFATWLGGIAAGALAKKWPLRSPLSRRLTFVFSLAVAVGDVVLSAGHRLSRLPGDYLLGLAGLGLIWAALSSPPAKGLSAKIAVLLSEISYTLYLTHAPMLALLGGFWLRGRRWPADLAHLALSTVPMASAVLFAIFMYFLFESRTDSVRKWIKTR